MASIAPRDYQGDVASGRDDKRLGEFARLRAEGWTFDEISQCTGWTPGTAHRALVMAGLHIVVSNREQRVRNDKAILAVYAPELTYAQIAKRAARRLGDGSKPVSTWTVARVLLDAGLREPGPKQIDARRIDRQRFRTLRSTRPDWTSHQFAKELGCSPSYARTLARQLGCPVNKPTVDHDAIVARWKEAPGMTRGQLAAEFDICARSVTEAFQAHGLDQNARRDYRHAQIIELATNNPTMNNQQIADALHTSRREVDRALNEQRSGRSVHNPQLTQRAPFSFTPRVMASIVVAAAWSARPQR